MGFNIWATGIRGPKKKLFQYSKKNCLDQGDFEPPKLLSMVPSSPNAAGVAKKVVGTPESHVGGATVKGMFKIAELEMIHLLTTSVTALAMKGTFGKINLYCEEENTFWANTNSFVTFYLNSGDPGKDFIDKIGKGLVETDLNNFGVLAQLAICIGEYSTKIPGGVTPFLNISLTH